MSFNKVILVGNLGRDPELRYTPAGDAVCNFSIATNEKRKVDGEYKDHVTWFKVTLWKRMAENAAQYLVKGRPVYIEGRLRVEEWTDRDGKQRHTLEVNATDMQFIGGNERQEDRPKERAAAASGGAVAGDEEDPLAAFDDSEIPF